MNDPQFPDPRPQIREALKKALARDSVPVPPMPAPPPEVVAWIHRQVTKAAAFFTAITGGVMGPGDGRAFAWFVAVLFWLLEIWQSRKAEKARIAAAPVFTPLRCPLTCPHGDQCNLTAGHDGGCNHAVCDCNESNTAAA